MPFSTTQKHFKASKKTGQSPDKETLEGRLIRVRKLLESCLLADETSEDYNSHPLRFQFAEGLRLFQEASINPQTHKRDNWTTIRDNLATPDYVHDGFSTTYLNEVIRVKGDPQPDRKYIRPKQITLALYFISHYANQCNFDIRAERGALIFLIEETIIYRCELPKDGNVYFLIYYCQRSQDQGVSSVGYGLLTRHAADWSDSELTIFQPAYTDMTLISTESYMADSQVHIRMQDRYPEQPSSDSNRPAIYAQLTLNVYHAQQAILLGTYSTTHRRPGEAMAGTIVLMRYETLAEVTVELDSYKQKIKESPIEIQYFLSHQRMEVKAGDFQTVAELPWAKEVQRLQTYVGNYQGYYVHPERGKNQVVKYILQIEATGKILCTYGDPDSPKIVNGVVQLVDDVLWLDLDFQPDSELYRFRYLLWAQPQKLNHRKCLLGIHSGLSRGMAMPTSGRMILEETHKPTVGLWNLSDFYRNGDYSDFYRFLTGQHPIEHNRSFTDSFLTDFTKTTESLPKENLIAKFSGYYDCYMCDRHGEEDLFKIYRYLLHIQSDGQVEFMRANEQCIGRAELHQQTNYLQIQLDPKGRSGFFGTILFSLSFGSIKVKQRTDIQHLFGVMAKLDSQRTEAMAVVLHRATDSSYEEIDPDTIQEEFRRSLDTLHRDQQEFDFDLYDKHLMGGLSFLMGQMHRLIRLPRTPNRIFRPRKEECRRVNFYAACHLMNQVKVLLKKDKAQKRSLATAKGLNQFQLTIAKVKDYLTEAYRHGFAADQFAGYYVNTAIQKKQLREHLAKQRVLTKQLDELDKELISLDEDRKLLINTLKKWKSISVTTEFATDVGSITELIETLWPYLRVSPILISPPLAS